VLLRWSSPLLYLTHHNACTLFDGKGNGVLNTTYSRSQLLANPVSSKKLRSEAKRCGYPKLTLTYESYVAGACSSCAMLCQSRPKRLVTKHVGRRTKSQDQCRLCINHRDDDTADFRSEYIAKVSKLYSTKIFHLLR
jgi:hypothetical protein